MIIFDQLTWDKKHSLKPVLNTIMAAFDGEQCVCWQFLPSVVYIVL